MNQLQFNHLKGSKGIRRIINAAQYSKDGLKATFRYEAAFRQLVLLNSILLISVWLIDVKISIRMILILASFISLIVELINSSIEAIVDDISLELRPLAKQAKDIGSAAQMIALILLSILWIIALCQ